MLPCSVLSGADSGNVAASSCPVRVRAQKYESTLTASRRRHTVEGAM